MSSIDPELPTRINALGINPTAIERITVTSRDGKQLVVLDNQEKQANSLQLYSHLTANDGTISPADAKRGLTLFGDKIIAHRIANPGVHTAVEALEKIVENGAPARSIIERKYAAKPLPIFADEIRAIAKKFNNRVIIYDEAGILQTAQQLNKAFSWTHRWSPQDVFNFAAFKAAPFLDLQDILYKNGMGADCSSKPEIHAARALGLYGDKIMFTANGVDHTEYKLARDSRAIINFDDISDIRYYQDIVGALPTFAVLRYNPGTRKSGGNHVFGNTVDQKFGIPHEQMIDAVMELRQGGVQSIGLHMMVVSNERNAQNIINTSELMFELINEIKFETGEDIKFANLGGGIGTSYRPEDREAKLDEISAGIQANYNRLILGKGRKPVRLAMENGRYLTGQHGIGVAEVLRVQNKYHKFVRLNAAMPVNMRPGMYGSYHHMNVLGKENQPQDQVYRVVGNMCENNDHFAVDRALPQVESGDLLVMHNCGAHTPGMAFEYNGRLDCSHVLRRVDGSLLVMRREKDAIEYMAAQSHSPLFARYAEQVRSK